MNGTLQHSPISQNAQKAGETVPYLPSDQLNMTSSQFKAYHQHQQSISISTSDSTDSSPTTTISTVDDSSATEPSPGSSPESPMSKPPPSSFAIGTLNGRTSDDDNMMPPFAPLFDLQRPATPGKKPRRNLKNLAVNTSSSLPFGRAASTTSLPIVTNTDSTTSGLNSPLFFKPPTPHNRRRPSNLGLTIMTPANSKLPAQQVRLAIPPTPSLSRPNMLRHFQSSPSLPMCSPSFPTPSQFQSLNFCAPQAAEPSLPRIPLEPNDEMLEEEEQNFDVPQSREEKPEAYPNGPICVYGPHIDLYLEPTAEQALQYDVIMNVASEVRNPFAEASEPAAVSEIRFDGGGGIQFAPRRDNATLSNNSTKPDTRSEGDPAVESSSDCSPTTPKASPSFSSYLPQAKTYSRDPPEYIHIPWEHNTDIVPDLHRLVKLIDDRVKHGKRILVHCQCGVSRSASLVVAYGLYKDPTMSVQEAYDAVKRKSKWIGPNMNLIMQLQEFKSGLDRANGRLNFYGPSYGSSRALSPIQSSVSPSNDWRRPFAGGEGEAKIPQTAPLRPEGETSAQLTATERLSAVTPGPSSAPSGLSWPGDNKAQEFSSNNHSKSAEASASVPELLQASGAAYVDTKGQVVPVVRMNQEPFTERRSSQQARERPKSLNLSGISSFDHAPRPLLSPRAEQFAMIPLAPPREVDSADAFGLMSPQATEFASTPFDRATLLGSLGMGTAFQDNVLGRKPPPVQLPFQRSSQATRRSPELPKTSPESRFSSPSVREQEQVHGLRAQINDPSPGESALYDEMELDGDPDALMSPRATEFTRNPFAQSLEPLGTPAGDEGQPWAGEDDPRSPVQKGASPITRNILDYV
ncbi:tyrosine/serine/threonine protein phosphatase [Elasticomyces elasticus]|nr:tyrosine/serine/threonine protein phosphatase [Elasticomyces elasticus]